MNILNKLYVTCFRKERPKIMSNVLEAIGHTPLVQLNNIPREEGVNCRVCKLYLSWCIEGKTFICSTLMHRFGAHLQLKLVKTRPLVFLLFYSVKYGWFVFVLHLALYLVSINITHCLWVKSSCLQQALMTVFWTKNTVVFCFLTLLLFALWWFEYRQCLMSLQVDAILCSQQLVRTKEF